MRPRSVRRRVRADLGVPDVTTHNFRKSVATLIYDRGLSARIGADQLGHARPSMTQDRYMARGKLIPRLRRLLDAISGPKKAHRPDAAAKNSY
jgi:integrase